MLPGRIEIMVTVAPVRADSNAATAGRIDWVDTAKGICIIFVVMMHTTLGLEKAAGQTGWMHHVVAFAAPFRMPDFFLISGLFLAATIDRPWRLYLDRKVVHFAYFYVLWVLIQFAFKAPFMMRDGVAAADIFKTLAFTMVQPFGTLWFIYMLPVFFVITKLLKQRPYWLLGAAALLEIMPVDSSRTLHLISDLFGVAPNEHGWVLVDEFCARFVYFVAGYIFASRIFDLAAFARAHVGLSVAGFALWFVVNGSLVAAGVSTWPIISIALGAAGAMAIVITSSLISRTRLFAFLKHLGANSIVVYLAFFVPMVVMRLTLLRFAPWMDIGTMSLISTVVGVAAPMVFYAVIRRTGWGMFLFHRPNWAIIAHKPVSSTKAVLQAAE